MTTEQEWINWILGFTKEMPVLGKDWFEPPDVNMSDEELGIGAEE